MRLAVLALTVGVVLPGLSGVAEAQPPVPEPVAIPEAPPGTPATMFADSPAIVNVYPTRPQGWSRVADERTLRLHFTSGTPECYGVTATVQESAERVLVDLRTGTLPQAVDRVCVMIAVSGALDVPLTQPLGARPVLSLT